MKKINVLVAIDHAGYKGNMAGIGHYLCNTLPHLDFNTFNITVLILREKADIDIFFEHTAIRTLQLNRSKYDPLTIIDMLKIIDEEDIHIMHLHQYGVSNFGRIISRMKNIPILLHLHGPDPDYPTIQRIADLVLGNASTAIIAVSQETMEDGLSTRHLKPKYSAVLKNGICLDRFRSISACKCREVRKTMKIPLNSYVVGTVTRFHHGKGNDIFLDSFAHVVKAFPTACAILIGDGPLKQHLRRQAATLKLTDNVVFTGYQTNIINITSIFDLMIIPSFSEGQSQVKLEAMAMGKCIIASDIRGLSDTIIDNVTGALVPVRNPEALSKKVIFLLNNPAERKKLEENALATSKEYSIEKHALQLEKVYKSVVAQNYEHASQEN